MQSIITKILPQTEKRPRRVKASATGKAGSKSINYDCELSELDNHCLAVKSLCRLLGWKGKAWFGQNYVGGYIFVFEDPTADNFELI